MRALALISILSSAACDGSSSSAVDAAPPPDAPAGLRSDHDFVITRIVLPTNQDEADEAAFAWPGTDGRAVNKMGGLIHVLLSLVEGIPVQAEMDANFRAGASLQLGRIHSIDLVNDDGAIARFADLVDADDPPDPSNDFGGTGEFRIAASGPVADWLTTLTISQGTTEGEGPDVTVTLGLPLITGDPPVRVLSAYPQLRGTADGLGFTGFVGGALTTETIQNDIYPAIAKLMTRAIVEMTPQWATIQALFDLNGDFMVTTQELIDNDMMDTLTSPDVDLDGAGGFDHVSVGVGIESVPCVIVP